MYMANQMTLISSVEDVTAAWMTNVMRDHGSLSDDQDVTAVEAVSLGEQAGLLGILYRATMTYSDGAAGPASAIIKVPTDDPAQRGVADLLGFFNRECTFYSERADTTSFRTAKIYGMVRPTAESTDFVIVMEDLGHLNQVDQVAGATLAETESAIIAIAKQHARYWLHDDLPSLADPFMPLDGPVYQAALPQVFAGGWPAAKEHGAGVLTAEMIEFGDRYGEVLPFMLEALSAPATLCHGDFRGDNLMFDEEGNISIIDFQIVGVGHGSFDIGYFMSQSLESDVRKEHEGHILALYTKTLNEAGIDISIEDVTAKYRIALALCFIYAVTSFQAWEAFDGRQHELMTKMLARSAQASIDNDSLSLLPL